MDAIFSAYDRWNGFIPLLCGIYSTLLAYGYLPKKPKDPERLALWRKRFGPMMKILGPMLIVIGLVSLVFHFLK